MSEKKYELLNAIEKYNLGKINDARAKFEILVKKYPKDTDILFNYGVFLGEIGEYEEEQKTYKKLIKFEPEDSAALTNLAVSLNASKKYHEAIFYSTKALNKKSNMHQAYEARGLARINIADIKNGIHDLKKWIDLLLLKNTNDKAKKIFQSCIDLINIPQIYKNENEVKLVRCDIEKKIDEVLENLNKLSKEEIDSNDLGKKIAFKLNYFYLAYQQNDDKEVNEKYNKILFKLLNINNEKNYYINNKKLKLAIISTFQFHPKLFIFDQIEKIDQSKYNIEIIIFNNSSFKVKELYKYKNEHLKIKAESYEAIIKYLESKNFDVIFFPDVGMSIASRILTLKKLAKVTATTWLHPVTTGSKAVDFFLSGKLMEKIDAQKYYTEKLIQLPGIGLHIDPLDYICTSVEEITKRKYTQNKFQIGIIQVPFKIHPKMDKILVAIAKKIPNVEFIIVGLLNEMDTQLISRLQKNFKLAGIDHRKINLVKRMEKNVYRKFLKKIDIAIDGIGWSGGNTTLDAFGAALPVLTMEGIQMRANHTAGMYRLLNLEGFISSSEEKLIERAIHLSEDNNFLTEQKIQLFNNFSKLKTERYISNFFNQLTFS